MQIEFKGQYDKDLFFKAVALANRPPKNRQHLLSALIVIAIGATAVIGYRIFTSGDWGENFVYLLAAIFMGAYVAYILLRPFIAARKLWANPGTQRPLMGAITKTGITYVFPEGETTIEWERFNRLQKTGDLVTLVREDGLLVVFPRHFFESERNWQMFQRFIDDKVTPLDDKGIHRPARSK
jgi:hypothetical protein